MEITAKIIAILPTQSGQGSKGAWVKNSFVVEWTENNYPQKLCLEVMGEDKFEKMKNSVRVGNEVVVRFNVSSREYQGRWFTTAMCFYCNSVYAGQQQEQSPVPNAQPYTPQDDGQDSGDDSELPF